MIRNHYRINSRNRRRAKKLKVLVVLGCLVTSGWFAFKVVAMRSTGSTSASTALNHAINQPASAQTKTLPGPLPWPQAGIAAYSVPSDKLTVTSNQKSEPVPIASLAKIITLAAVMRQKPLQPGEQGPTITITDADIALYNEYISKSGTVTLIAPGEQITQYQAMQAIMHASSNNLADTLAIWAFGSIDEYTHYANDMVQQLGLSNTHIADASGYSPGTVSTVEDMTELSFIYLKDPVLREIAQQSQSTIPVAGTIRNFNTFINNDHAFGLKAGFTDEAGKCFIVASIRKTAVKDEEISVAVVLGSNSIPQAANDAMKVIESGNSEHDRSTP